LEANFSASSILSSELQVLEVDVVSVRHFGGVKFSVSRGNDSLKTNHLLQAPMYSLSSLECGFIALRRGFRELSQSSNRNYHHGGISQFDRIYVIFAFLGTSKSKDHAYSLVSQQ
jgi:hypothetical protein